MERPTTTNRPPRPATHAGRVGSPAPLADGPFRDKRLLGAAAAIIVLLLAWLFWPSPYGGVKNLASGGSGVIAFGDSLTAGYGAGPGQDYPSRLAVRTGITIVNAGVSGDTTESALRRIEPDVLSNRPRVLIVGLGGNDFLRGVPIGTTEANLRTIVRRAQGAGAMVVLLGFEFPSITASYAKMYERVADEEGCLFIPDMLDGILANPALKSDEIHPNASGYELMAERVEKPLRALLKKADGTR
ncbi:MAG: arylesterase [Acidobacteria bacterium]|nr:arylesterase [Acidobacteriota bacterium]